MVPGALGEFLEELWEPFWSQDCTKLKEQRKRDLAECPQAVFVENKIKMTPARDPKQRIKKTKKNIWILGSGRGLNG